MVAFAQMRNAGELGLSIMARPCSPKPGQYTALRGAKPGALVERLGGHSDWSARQGFRAIDLAEVDVPAYEGE